MAAASITRFAAETPFWTCRPLAVGHRTADSRSLLVACRHLAVTAVTAGSTASAAPAGTSMHTSTAAGRRRRRWRERRVRFVILYKI